MWIGARIKTEAVAVGMLCLRWALAIALILIQSVAAAQTERSTLADGAVGHAGESPGEPVLKVGITRGGWPPFDDTVDGSLTGLSVAYLDAALGPGHHPFEIRAFSSQAALQSAACRGEVDIVPDQARTAELDACLIFSKPYYQGQLVALTREGNQAVVEDSTSGSPMYAVEDTSIMLPSLSERYPNATFLRTRTTREALEAVASGKADAYIGLRPAVELEVKDGSLPALAIVDLPADPLGELRFAFPRSRAMLRDRIDQGLTEIDPEARTKLLSSWITFGFAPSPRAAQKVPGIVLSAAEQAFLARLRPLNAAVGVRGAPFSYLDDSGRPTGILPEYLGVIAQSLGIRIEQYSEPTPAAEGRALELGTADLIVTVVPDRLDSHTPDITRPVAVYPLVVVGPRDAATVSGMAQLAGKRVAVAERTNNLELLRAGAPSAIPIETNSIESAMRLVHEGKADALIGNLAVIDLPMNRQYAGELKVLGPAGAQQAIGFQVRPEFAPLVPLINRVIAAVPEAERASIHNRYLETHYEFGLSWWQVARRAGPVVLIGLFSFTILAVGYVRLRREVRQRKQTEQALRTQLSFRSTLLDMVPFPIGVRDGEGAYLDVNAASEKAMGLSRDVVIGRTIEDCVALSDLEGTLTSHALLTTQREATYDAVRVDFLDANGESRHGLYWHRPFYNDAGGVAGTVGVVVDVTALLQAERKAHETEARLEDVTQNLPAAVFQMRRDASGDFSYEYVGSNQALLPDIRRKGLRRDPDKHPLMLRRHEMTHLITAINESARSLRPLDETFKVGEAAGVQWLKIRAVPRKEEGGSTLWNGYWIDTTRDQLRAIEVEAARMAAESASKAKDEFVAVMSHEIRTPMTGVIGLIEMLLRTELRGEQATMVGMVHESADALLQILDDVLDYSKIQADRLSIDEASFDLREATDVALGLLAMRAHQKLLTLRCRVGRRVAAMHRGDSVRLRQILFNLLGNAIKFTSSGMVSLAVDVESDTGDAQTIVMTVTDTGIGIDEHVIPTLFTPFVQGDSSTSRRFGGTGLGLVICKKLVTLMDGDIQIHSKSGSGTTVVVRVKLPIEIRHGRQADDASTSAVRVAVRVHDPDVAESLADGLAALGVSVDVQEPAVQRLEGAAASVPHADVVFMDEGDVLKASSGDMRVIRVSRSPEAAGYRVSSAGIDVSVNPMSFRGLRAAWQEALKSGTLPDEPTQIGLEPVRHGPLRTREQAIRDGVLILVAEDNPVNRYLIKSQLESFGCACDLTEDGVEALAAYEKNDYALLITDCQMPHVDGYTLTRAIRKRERKSRTVRDVRDGPGNIPHLPIIALTATSGGSEVSRCIKAGMDDYLRKPAPLEVLRACLMRWAPQCLQFDESELPPGEGEVANGTPLTTSLVGSQDRADNLPPLDWDAINRSMGGAAPTSILMDIVIESLRSDTASLRELLPGADLGLLRQWVHRTKGGAATMRYQPLIKALAEFHAEMKSEDVALLQQSGKKLLDLLERIVSNASQQRSDADFQTD